MQCCGLRADQIYRCEVIDKPGHKCQVGEHTILHERMGNAYSCLAAEDWLRNRGGLGGWIQSKRTSFHRIGS